MIFAFATLGLRFDGASLDRSGLGGSETACICLARELRKRGHEVHVFCFTDRPGDYDGVVYHPIEELLVYNAEHRFDVFVCSRFAEIMHNEIKARYKMLWLHDMPSRLPELAGALWQIDRIVVLSKFHREQWLKAMPAIEPLLWQSSNGVDLDLVNANIRPKVPGKLIYTSRPERGLIYLLRDIFPKLLADRPELKLHVCSYDTDGLPTDPEVQKVIAECGRLMAGLGSSVVNMGSLTKERLYQEISSSELWLYPCEFPEISCIGLAESLACGTWPITTKAFALTELVCCESKVKAGREVKPGKIPCVMDDWDNPLEYASVGTLVDLPFDEDYILNFVERSGSLLRMSNGKDYRQTSSYLDRFNKPWSQGWLKHIGFTWPAVAEKWEEWASVELTARQYDCWEDSVDGVKVVKRSGFTEPSIACCMIVKNEEADIYRCLQHVAPWVDEFQIVVDDESTDRTRKIASDFLEKWHDGAEDHEFRNYDIEFFNFKDFASMRNHGIENTDADWILWIDADEVLLGGEHLRKYLATAFYEGYAIAQKHLMVDGTAPDDFPIRIFRNRPHYKFTGYVHEHPDDLSKGKYDHPIEPAMIIPDVALAHYGYLCEPLRREKASNRNMELLRRSSREEPDRLYTKAMIIRDLMNRARWHVETRTPIVAGDGVHLSLQHAIDVYLQHFADEAHPLHAMTYPLYQEVLVTLAFFGLCCSGESAPPIEVAFGAMGSGQRTGLPDKQKLVGQSVWYVNWKQFQAHVDRRMDQLRAAIVPEPKAITEAMHKLSADELLEPVTDIMPHRYSKHGRRAETALAETGVT